MKINVLMLNMATTLMLLGSSTAYAQQVSDFKSSRGTIETCTIAAHIPGGIYTEKDLKKETEYCSLDFNNNSIALCPKTWSTSAGVVFYELQDNLNSQQFEAQRCAMKKENKTIAKLKFTVNEKDTSATNSKSSILYYHFSRLFNASILVPVAVKRTMDRVDLYNRVSSKAHGQGSMNSAAWKHINNWIRGTFNNITNPDLFENSDSVYGVVLHPRGVRYGTEINGVRSSWGAPQNIDFQNTAAFTALRSQLPLLDSMREGIRKAQANPALAKDLAGSPSDLQMVMWMQDLTEITLLDYIFSQQDRIGNIDYEWQWYYVQDGAVKTLINKSDLPRSAMQSMTPPAEIADFHPQLIQKTWIGDNDAGAKINYLNYTKTTKMLEGIRHYNSNLYKSLMSLNRDLIAKGPVYSYVSQSFKLSSAEISMIVNNVQQAATILKSKCHSGQLSFDLQPNKLILGQPTQEVVDCEGN